MSKQFDSRRIAVLTLILLIGAALRIVALTDNPPGLQHDEVFHAHDAFTVQEGNLSLWFSSNAGNEPLFIYLMALTTGLFGGNVLGIRIAAVWAGLLTIALIGRWGHRAFGTRVGVLAAAFAAVVFWPVWMSRVGLRVVMLPPTAALAGWLYTRALMHGASQGRIRRYALAGFAMGLTLYTYPAAFAVPLIFAALYGLMLLFQRRVLRKDWRGHLAFWLSGGLIYLPLGLALARAEGGYLRVQQTAVPLQALREGDPGPLLDAVGRTGLMWVYRGDPLWRYNVADRPVFGPVLAVLFVIGVVATVWLGLRGQGGREGAMRAAWLLIPLWLLIGVMPSAVTDSPPAFLRATTALPPTFIALGLGFELLRTLMLTRGWGRWWPALVTALIAATAGFTAQAYFGVWAGNAEVQRAYRTDLAEVAAYLEANPPPGGVAISTSEPHHLDRFIFDYTPHGDAEIHWFDGLYAIVAPAGDAPGWLFVTREPDPGEALRDAYLSQLRLIEDRNFDNGARAFTLYEIPPGDAFYDAFPPPASQPLAVGPLDSPQSVEYPVVFGDVLELVGYDAAPESPPGVWLPLTLHFRVLRDVTAPEPWVLFAHLLNDSGELVAGRDFLAVPASTWRAGDAFVQLHDLPLPDDLPAGDYHLEIGLYSQADGLRFPLMVDGEPLDDRLLLNAVRITDDE